MGALDGRVAAVFGGAGAIGGAVARAFGAAGAHVVLGGRTLARVTAVAAEIEGAGGSASAAFVDAQSADAVEAFLTEAGRLDICFNAIGVEAVMNEPLVGMSVEDFLLPVTQLARTTFLTSTAAARRMTAQGSGVIILLSSSAAQESRHEMGGWNLACAGVEALTRSLAGEVGRSGVRVVCLRPNFTPETAPEIPEQPQLLRDTLLGRLPRLAELAGTAVYLASDAAGAMTGAVVNLSCGAVTD